jgi:tetratricopeptide (TPR) repeat protein
MAQQLRILLEIYYRPHAAFCRVLDEGKFLFAALAALVTGVLFFGLLFNSVLTEGLQAARAFNPQAAKQLDPSTEAPPGQPAPLPGSPLAATRLLAGPGVFSSLAVLAGLYVPAAIVVIALWDALGGAATILRRDYLPVLTCHLLSYAAVLLPLACLRMILPLPFSAWLGLIAIFAAYFLFLSGCSLRAVMGTTSVHAVFTTGAACGAAVIGGVLFTFMGSSTYYLTSPFLLYYAYSYFQGDIRIIGSGLSSRQNLRRQLEISKLNPRDWDAHLQVGLIQAQRRQFAEAGASFKKAIEIAPNEAEAYFHLAKIAREQGRPEEALGLLRTAAALDDKLSGSEVWKDLGASALLADHPEEARPALAKYIQRRPYDPEGLYWYGRVLKKLGEPAAAKEALEQSLEAVATAPSHQRGRLRKWASEAKTELKSL